MVMPAEHRTENITRPIVVAMTVVTFMAAHALAAVETGKIFTFKNLSSADAVGDTPSIFFVIDNSHSMDYSSPTGTPNPNDRWGNRFKVPAAFTDTIYKYYPTAQIGFAVFNSYLYFRPADNTLFARLPPPLDTFGGYIPLFTLNKTYGNKLGYQIVKQFLAIDTAVAPSPYNIKYMTLVYKPSVPWPTDSTNITLGFEAAKNAMLSSAHPPQNQFILFFSDGDATAPKKNPWEFVTGTGVPTTFTVFFTPNAQVPPKIDTMTMNIRNNGYSASNPNSNVWPYQNTTSDSLMSFLMNDIFPSIVPGPVGISIQTIPADTVSAGDTVILWGSCFDRSGKRLPAQSDSIRWAIDSSGSLAGDRLSGSENDSAAFTATVAFRWVRIIGYCQNGNSLLIDTTRIYVKPAAASQVDIEMQNATALSAAQVITSTRPTVAQPRLSIYFDSSQVLMYAYAVLRDRYGNVTQLAERAGWTSLNADTATATGTANKLYEGQIVHTPGARQGSTLVIASSANCTPDTAQVVIRPDRLMAIRLVNAAQPMVALDTIGMTTAESMDIKVQAIWSTAPSIWVNGSGMWSIDPDTFRTVSPVPIMESGLWTCKAISIGAASLTVTAGAAHVTVPMIITGAGVPPHLTLTLLNDPDSCFAGTPIRLKAYFETSTGPLPGTWCCSAVLHDAAANDTANPRPWIFISGNGNNGKEKDSLDKTVTECFLNGSDTISLFLYHITNNQDSQHQLQLTLNGQYSCKTVAFKVKGAPPGIIIPRDVAGKNDIRFIIRKNSVRVLMPQSGEHDVSVYSFSGRRLESRSTCGDEIILRLPRGGYVIAVGTAGSERQTRKIFLQ